MDVEETEAARKLREEIVHSEKLNDYEGIPLFANDMPEGDNDAFDGLKAVLEETAPKVSVSLMFLRRSSHPIAFLRLLQLSHTLSSAFITLLAFLPSPSVHFNLAEQQCVHF